MRYVILLVELSISSFEIFHFGRWPFGGAILKKSAIFCISETINRVAFKLFLHQFRYVEKLQKYKNRYYRVIQNPEKAIFRKFANLWKWPHQINSWKNQKLFDYRCLDSQKEEHITCYLRICHFVWKFFILLNDKKTSWIFICFDLIQIFREIASLSFQVRWRHPFLTKVNKKSLKERFTL